MIANREPDENAPNHPRPAAKGEEPERQRDLKRDVEVLQRAIERFGVEVGGEVTHFLIRRQRDVMPVNPVHVRPLKALRNTMRVALMIGMGVVLAVHRYPANGIGL